MITLIMTYRKYSRLAGNNSPIHLFKLIIRLVYWIASDFEVEDNAQPHLVNLYVT